MVEEHKYKIPSKIFKNKEFLMQSVKEAEEKEYSISETQSSPSSIIQCESVILKGSNEKISLKLMPELNSEEVKSDIESDSISLDMIKEEARKELERFKEVQKEYMELLYEKKELSKEYKEMKQKNETKKEEDEERKNKINEFIDEVMKRLDSKLDNDLKNYEKTLQAKKPH